MRGVVSKYTFFSEELAKSAMAVPKIPTSLHVPMPKSGAGIASALTAPPRPALGGPRSLPQAALGKVPMASGRSLGTKVLPRTKSTPSVNISGSLVR